MKIRTSILILILPFLGMCQIPKNVKIIIEYRYGIDNNWKIKKEGYREFVKYFDKNGLKVKEINFNQKGDTLYYYKYDYDSLRQCIRITKYNRHRDVVEDERATYNSSGKLIPFLVREHPSMNCNNPNNKCKFDKQGNKIEMVVYDEPTKKNLYKMRYEYLFW